MSIGRRSALYALAALVLCVAAIAPLDRLADRSFAWHMLQHLTLFFLVPLLALLARPFSFVAAAIGKTRTAALVRSTKALHVLGSPVAGYGALLATMWLTHFSPLYELSLEHEWIHALEHALYLLGGTLFWLPVVAPPPLRPMSYPARAFYLFLALPQSALLGAAIFAARAPLYAHYAARETFGGALADQQNAAALVWIGSGFVTLCAMLTTIAIWAAREATEC